MITCNDAYNSVLGYELPYVYRRRRFGKIKALPWRILANVLWWAAEGTRTVGHWSGDLVAIPANGASRRATDAEYEAVMKEVPPQTPEERALGRAMLVKKKEMEERILRGEPWP